VNLKRKIAGAGAKTLSQNEWLRGVNLTVPFILKK
jgi:hypothetical protein